MAKGVICLGLWLLPHSAALSVHPGSGAVMSQTGSFAVLMLIGLIGVRFAVRNELARATVVDASLLVALSRGVTQRLAT